MRVLLATSLLLATACGEMFPPASAVTDFRAVAARVDVLSEPGRANPLPEEDVVVSMLVIDRGALPSEDPDTPTLTPPLLQWLFIPCIPLPVTIGTPICGPPIQPCEGCVGTPPDDPLAFPIMRFQTPSEQTLEEASASSVLLQGIVCGNGTPSIEALERFATGQADDLVLCEGPIDESRSVEGRVVSVTIPIETDAADPNLNPVLQNALLNGAAWPPPYDQAVPRDAPKIGCADDLANLTEQARAAHPRAGQQPSSIDLSVTRGSLQTFTVGDTELTEEIQVSWLGDGGRFERSFSFITDPASSVLTQWQPAPEAPAEGELVRFHFVIRDGRGGTDAFERGLCVLPP